MFEKLTVRIFGQEYIDTVMKRAQSIVMMKEQRKIKNALQTQKAIWMNLTATQRKTFKLIVEGQQITYITICRIF